MPLVLGCLAVISSSVVKNNTPSQKDCRLSSDGLGAGNLGILSLTNLLWRKTLSITRFVESRLENRMSLYSTACGTAGGRFNDDLRALAKGTTLCSRRCTRSHVRAANNSFTSRSLDFRLSRKKTYIRRYWLGSTEKWAMWRRLHS